MPSVLTIKSYNPVTKEVVNKHTHETSKRVAQNLALRSLRMTEAGFKKIIKMQNLKTIGNTNEGNSMVRMSGPEGIMCYEYDEETGRCDCSGLT